MPLKLKHNITTADICAGQRCSAPSSYALAPTAHKLPIKGDIGFCEVCWNRRCADAVKDEVRLVPKPARKPVRKPAAVAASSKRDKAEEPTIRMRRRRTWC